MCAASFSETELLPILKAGKPVQYRCCRKCGAFYWGSEAVSHRLNCSGDKKSYEPDPKPVKKPKKGKK